MRPRVYTVTPELEDESRLPFRDRVRRTAQDSEAAEWDGILVPHNLHDLDPWLVAAHLASATKSLIPLIAVQPACVPPHTAAALAAAFAALYDRPLYFNLVAGARNDEMRRIGDTLSHDERYERLAEYAQVLRGLLQGAEVSLRTKHYVFDRFRLEPRPEVLGQCRIFLAGSSPASMRVAAEHADVAVTQPTPLESWLEQVIRPLTELGFAREIGIRVGLICRASRVEAWQLAHARFPETWLGKQETMLKTISPNAWAKRLAELAMAEAEAAEQDPGRTYWLGAFRAGRASAPFLVGSYEEVARSLGEYMAAGARHILLNGVHEDDYGHTRKVIELAAGWSQDRSAQVG